MTHQLHPIHFQEVFQSLAEQGFDGMAQAMQVLLNECMKIERQQAIGAAPFERREDRRGQANGFKPKRVKTRIGELQLAVPQVRGMQFYPSALERGVRSEKALKLALAEVVRNLALRDHEKGLSTGEKQMYVKAKKILASELMYAKDMSEDEAHEWLEEVLANPAKGKRAKAKPKTAATATA